MVMINSRQPKQNSWRDQVKFLQDMRREHTANEAIMTPYERKVNYQAIDDQSKAYFQNIVTGARQQFETARTNYQNAEAEIRKAEAKEANRWDAAKLTAEMNAIKTQVDQALNVKADPMGVNKQAAARIAKIYKDAMQDGADIHRKRAAAEILQDVDPARLPAGQQVPVAVIVRDAKEKLTDLRVTDDLVKANKAADEAWDGLKLAHVEVVEAMRAVGEGDPSSPFDGQVKPLGNLLRTVQVQDGKVVILAEDDTAVTGIGQIAVKG